MAGLVLTAPLLHISADRWYVPSPALSHSAFGVGFLLLGSLMLIECLDRESWYRSTLRMMIFPSLLVVLGFGMVAVTAIEPSARLAHFAMGTPLTLAGVAEARVRLEQMGRRLADALIVIGLLFASFETSVYHLSGSPGSGVYLTHLGIVIAGVALAVLRLYESRDPDSRLRSLLICAVIFAIAIDLFADSYFQATI